MSVRSTSRCPSARSSTTIKYSRALSQANLNYESIKQSHLTWLFNRRKLNLQKTSQQNIALFLRIQAQKPIVNFGKPKTKNNIRSRVILSNKQNINIEKVNQQISRRSKQLSKQLNFNKYNPLLRY